MLVQNASWRPGVGASMITTELVGTSHLGLGLAVLIQGEVA